MKGCARATSAISAISAIDICESDASKGGEGAAPAARRRTLAPQPQHDRPRMGAPHAHARRLLGGTDGAAGPVVDGDEGTLHPARHAQLQPEGGRRRSVAVAVAAVVAAVVATVATVASSEVVQVD